MLKVLFVGALTTVVCLSVADRLYPGAAPTVGKNSAIPKAIPGTVTTANPNGKLQSYQSGGTTITANNAFFQSLGTNGRSCFSCHRPQDDWSISAADANARFKATNGKDPIFTPSDGATNPTDDLSSIEAMKRAYQLLLGQGLIRIARPMPSEELLQFSITSVSDPYGCNTDPNLGLSSSASGTVSIYRRPLPATNLKFDSTLMWDGREPNLASQAIDATIVHAQSTTPLDDAELNQMVGFESGIFTAQAKAMALDLSSNGAMGGPVALSMQRFFVGINDPFGANPMSTPFDPHIFNLFRGVGYSDKDRLESGSRIAPIHRARRADIQHQDLHDLGRCRSQRCARPSLDNRHLRHLSRYAESWESLRRWHPGHWYLGSVASRSGLAATRFHHPLR